MPVDMCTHLWILEVLEYVYYGTQHVIVCVSCMCARVLSWASCASCACVGWRLGAWEREQETALIFNRDDKKPQGVWPVWDLPSSRQGIDKIIVE